jgi:hypothetical protein
MVNSDDFNILAGRFGVTVATDSSIRRRAGALSRFGGIAIRIGEFRDDFAAADERLELLA